MAKRLEYHPIRYGKYHAGCVWGFINSLEFRHGRSPRRLLEDKRTTSKRNLGARYYWSKLQKLTDPNGDSREFYDGEGRDALIADITKTSVKELMEEEMLSEQEQNRQSSADIQTKESVSESRGNVKRNCKSTNKFTTIACDIHDELDAAGNFGSEDCFRQDSEETNLDVKLDSHSDIQSEQAHSVFTGKLIDAVKVFVDQRLTVGKDLRKYEETERSDEFMSALQTFSSNKELILKLLKDPNSLLVKHIEDLEDPQAEEDQNPSSLEEYILIDQELKVSKPSEPVARKQHNFFRRKSKSQEKILLKGHENCQTSNRIVILKPGPPSVHISQPEVKHSSLRSSHQKVQTERIASQFSLNKIRRKLKNAMGKERHGVPSDDIIRRVFDKHQISESSGKGVGGEMVRWNSPNRNHFFNERFARLTIGIKNKEKSCKPDDPETSLGSRDGKNSKVMVYNDLYVEPKKRLSEMLRDEIEDFPSMQPPKALGMIPSLSDFNLSPNSVKAQQRSSHDGSFDEVNEDPWQITPDEDVRHLGPSREIFIMGSCTTENPEITVQSCYLNSDVLDELSHTNAVEATLCSMIPEKNFEADVEIVEITAASFQEESKVLSIPVETVIRDEQDGDLTEAFDEDGYAQHLKLESFEEGQLPSSPLTSAPSSSIINLVPDLDISNEKPERHSPVSVLEPVFTDDDVSPKIIKSLPVEFPLQPREIIFDERFTSATNQGCVLRSCMEDEESSFDYVETVLLASGLNADEFLSRWLSSNQILDASLFDEVELFSNRSRQDQKLLFDCTNEVLKVIFVRHFARHDISSIPRGKSLIDKVWDGVEGFILSQPYSSTLDQIVGIDMFKTGTWLDLQFDVKSIGTKIAEALFKELVDEIIRTFLNEGPKTCSSAQPENLIEIE